MAWSNHVALYHGGDAAFLADQDRFSAFCKMFDFVREHNARYDAGAAPYRLALNYRAAYLPHELLRGVMHHTTVPAPESRCGGAPSCWQSSPSVHGRGGQHGSTWAWPLCNAGVVRRASALACRGSLSRAPLRACRTKARALRSARKLQAGSCGAGKAPCASGMCCR